MRWEELVEEKNQSLARRLADRAEACRWRGEAIYPPQDEIFRALTLTPPDKVKVCIIGQDPYHTEGAANGLAFSISPGRRIQPSLRNIFTELHSDLGVPVPESGDLTPWAERGVLLLNTILTVKAGLPYSHSIWGWQEYTGNIFKICREVLPQPVVFFLWGKAAQAFAADTDWGSYGNKLAIMSLHPSPMSAYRGFFGSRPFSHANAFLEAHGAGPVDWSL